MYIFLLRSCKFMDAFITPSFLPSCRKNYNSRVPLLHGSCPVSSLLRTHPPPSRLQPISRCLRLYGLTCSAHFCVGRGRLLQLVVVSLSACRRYHPAGMNQSFQSAFDCS